MSRLSKLLDGLVPFTILLVSLVVGVPDAFGATTQGCEATAYQDQNGHSVWSCTTVLCIQGCSSSTTPMPGEERLYLNCSCPGATESVCSLLFSIPDTMDETNYVSHFAVVHGCLGPCGAGNCQVRYRYIDPVTSQWVEEEELPSPAPFSWTVKCVCAP